MNKTKVAIICGGPSSEHEISCLSGAGVLKGLDKTRFEAILIGITQVGEWFLLPLDYSLEIIDGVLPTIKANQSPVRLTSTGVEANGVALAIDCVFPVLHGEFGEDGKIQQLLEDASLSYVGSGVAASGHAMDKSIAKALFSQAGMQVAQGFEVLAHDWKLKTNSITYPVFVKPASGGSSKGTHKVKNALELEVAIIDALRFGEILLIEEAIIGREIECAVLERDGEIMASIPGEIIIDSKFEFYNFEAKYLDNATTVAIPADINPTDSAAISDLAIRAFLALGCQGLARCDFFYTPQGEIIINEINTMPGFTGTSVYPKLWQASNLSYSELITTLINSALQD